MGYFNSNKSVKKYHIV